MSFKLKLIGQDGEERCKTMYQPPTQLTVTDIQQLRTKKKFKTCIIFYNAFQRKINFFLAMPEIHQDLFWLKLHNAMRLHSMENVSDTKFNNFLTKQKIETNYILSTLKSPRYDFLTVG